MSGLDAAQFFAGFFAAIGLYNALVYVITRDKPFLWYAGIMLAMVAIQLHSDPGITIFFFGCEAGFAITFLRLPERLPQYVLPIVALFGVNVIGIALETRLPQSALHHALDDAALFAFLGVCAAAGWRSAFARYEDAGYYLLAFAGALAGVVVNDVAQNLHAGGSLLYAFQAGMAWEALFLALALAARVRYAKIDQVTGVKNRRAFDEELGAAFRRSRSSASALAVLFIDVDRFKQYNDEHGHPAGDALLRRIAYLCAGCCRDRGDLFARYGGDEFAAILMRVSPEQAQGVAARMRALVQETCRVTISVGVACMNDSTLSSTDLVAASDAELYRAKAELASQRA